MELQGYYPCLLYTSRDDIHEIVYEEDAQEAPEVEETRVTSSDFDKINVTDMHQDVYKRQEMVSRPGIYINTVQLVITLINILMGAFYLNIWLQAIDNGLHVILSLIYT